jgi:CRP-like cAMP-binding protein
MSYVALDIFQHLTTDDIHWILGSSTLRTLSPNGVLVREDDPSEAIFFVADGLLEVYVFAGLAGRLKVGQLGPGEVIGEISWLDHKPISASVRAIETSSVITLSTALLERKLHDDPKFAARFLRGVATLTAERLRKTTADLRRSQRADGAPMAAAAAPGETGLQQKLEAFKALAATANKQAGGGSKIADDTARDVRAAFMALEAAIPPLGEANAARFGEALHAELAPFADLSTTANRCRAKPRGYAGDYQTIEVICDNKPAGAGPLGTLLDGCVLSLAAMKAIRNRPRLLAAEILSLYRSTTKEFHVTALACGPASEVFEVFDKAHDKARLQVGCVDVDREALISLAERCRQRSIAEQVRTLQANLIHLATGQQALDLAPQDLIYSAGFADYLSDERVLTLLDWMHDKLRPGGCAILGNMHPRNPSRGFMEHVLDWRLTHRTEAEMNDLFQRSKFARPCSRIQFEEEGINLFAECRKQ